MPEIKHSALPFAAQGVVPAFYAANAAELASLAPTAAEVGKVAYQADTQELWLLVDATGPVWRPSGRRGFAASREVDDDFSFALLDAGGKVYVNKATAVVATVELNATVAYDGLNCLTAIQKGDGAFTLTPVSGSVTIIPPDGKTLVSNGVGAIVSLTPDPADLNTWNAYGDLVAA